MPLQFPFSPIFPPPHRGARAGDLPVPAETSPESDRPRRQRRWGGGGGLTCAQRQKGQKLVRPLPSGFFPPFPTPRGGGICLDPPFRPVGRLRAGRSVQAEEKPQRASSLAEQRDQRQPRDRAKPGGLNAPAPGLCPATWTPHRGCSRRSKLPGWGGEAHVWWRLSRLPVGRAGGSRHPSEEES